jgi:hypothetical protein
MFALTMVNQITNTGNPIPIKNAYITAWRSIKVLDTDSSHETEGSTKTTQLPFASSMQSKTLAIVLRTGE